MIPGIPDKTKSSPLPSVKDKNWEFSIQKHDAVRAGTHYDIRLGDPASGIAYSWAVRYIPEPGQKRLAIKQPDHTIDYMGFSGEIKSEYGKGKVSLVEKKTIRVLSADNNKVHFLVPEGNTYREYVIVRTGGNKWLMMNNTPKADIPGIGGKPKYKETYRTNLDPYKDDEVWQPKVDGAHVMIVAEPNKPLRVISYRKPKNKDIAIDHTYRVFDKPVKLTKGQLKSDRVIMRGELFAIDKKTGKTAPVTDTSGLLLSSIVKEKDKREQKNLDYRVMVFDIERDGDRELNNYEQVMNRVKEIINKVRTNKIMFPPVAKTPTQKFNLLKSIKNGENKLTSEGIVIWRKYPKAPVKHKLKRDWDVYIVKIFPGEGKYKGKGAGGFWYSLKKGGPIVGKVGNGFTDEQRIDMWRNPDKWVGKIAVVEAQDQYPSGALRMPVFKTLHLDKNVFL